MASDSGHGSAGSKALGRFELLGELHKGFFGPVWLAHATSGDDVGTVVLVRRVELTADVDDLAVATIAEAADRAKGVRHEALAATLEVVSEPRALAIVSAYNEAEPLRTVLRLAGIGRKPVPPAVAARIAIDVLDACAHLHELGSLAALTPDNVLVGSDGVTRVLEPLASQAAAGVTLWREQPKRATYASPEQFGAEAGDARSDVFSAGILLWEMLRNRPLFGGSNFAQVGERVCGAAIGRADALKPAGGEAIPKALADVVERSLARAPDDRFETAASFLTALEACEPADYEDVARYANELLAEAFGAQRRKLASFGGVEPEPAPKKTPPVAQAAPPKPAPSDASPAPLLEAERIPTAPAPEPEGVVKPPPKVKAGSIAEGESSTSPQPGKRRDAKKTLLGMAAPTSMRANAGETEAGLPHADKPKLPPRLAEEEELDLEPEPPSADLRGAGSEDDGALGDPDEAGAAPEKARAVAAGFDVMSIADDPSDPDDPSGEVAAALARQKQARATAPVFKTIQAAPSNKPKFVALGAGALALLAAAGFFATRGPGPTGDQEPAKPASTSASASTATVTAAPTAESAVPSAVATVPEVAPTAAPTAVTSAAAEPAAVAPPVASATKVAPAAAPQGPAPAVRPTMQPRRTNYVPSDI